MRIAQVAPLYEAVPPKLYGGTERVVSFLTEELVRQGHEVTLFASADSLTNARLVPCCEQALRLDPLSKDPLAHHFVMIEKVFAQATEFDIIHFHTDYLHFPLAKRHSGAHVTTLHGRLDIPDLEALYREYREMPVVSISDAQRRPLPWLNWAGTVRHGLRPDLFKLHSNRGQYLAFLGRISPEKGLERAIEIAMRTGMELKIAAKVDRSDKDYFESKIRPLLKNPGIDFIGEIGEREKDTFLGNAYALLFPIDWPEPFGLVMIEAMACGTPVIAFPCGAVPEVMEDGVTGYVVSNVQEAVQAVGRVASLNRVACRKAFETRWTSTRMAGDYLKIYASLAEEQQIHHAIKASQFLLGSKPAWANSGATPDEKWQAVQHLS